jgi:DNA-directed RNA polymerase, delta subunit
MLENFKNESMIDVAYGVLKSKTTPISFNDMYKEVAQKLGFTPEMASKKVTFFYTDLSLDGRFVDLKDNTWDLRERQTYDKVHIDMNDVYSDIDEETALNTDVEELDDSEKEEMGVQDDDDAPEDESDGESDDSSTKEDM